eukprot:485000_1
MGCKCSSLDDDEDVSINTDLKDTDLDTIASTIEYEDIYCRIRMKKNTNNQFIPPVTEITLDHILKRIFDKLGLNRSAIIHKDDIIDADELIVNWIFSRLHKLKQHRNYRLMKKKNCGLSDAELIALIVYTDSDKCCYKMKQAHRKLCDKKIWQTVYFHATKGVEKLYQVFHYRNKNAQQSLHLFHGSNIKSLDGFSKEQLFIKTLFSFSTDCTVANDFATGSILMLEDVSAALCSGQLKGADMSWISGYNEFEYILLPSTYYCWKQIKNQNVSVKFYKTRLYISNVDPFCTHSDIVLPTMKLDYSQYQNKFENNKCIQLQLQQRIVRRRIFTEANKSGKNSNYSSEFNNCTSVGGFGLSDDEKMQNDPNGIGSAPLSAEAPEFYPNLSILTTIEEEKQSQLRTDKKKRKNRKKGKRRKPSKKNLFVNQKYHPINDVDYDVKYDGDAGNNVQMVKDHILNEEWWMKKIIMTYGKQNTQRRTILSMNKSEFYQQCKSFVTNHKEDIKLTQIRMFDTNHNRWEPQYLFIVRIDESEDEKSDNLTDLGVSFKFTGNGFDVTGYHLNAENIKRSLFPNTLVHLNNFKSNITHLKLSGAPDEYFEE